VLCPHLTNTKSIPVIYDLLRIELETASDRGANNYPHVVSWDI